MQLGESAANTPLFRLPDGRPIIYQHMLRFVKDSMALIGEDPDKYGASSLRSGGATAASAVEGVTESQLKVIGYWASDAHLRYTRLVETNYQRIVTAMMNSRFTSLAPDTIK